MTVSTRKGRRSPTKKHAGPVDSPSRGAVARESTTLVNHVATFDPHTAAELAAIVSGKYRLDPGELCPNCLCPYREWYNVPACNCDREPPL